MPKIIDQSNICVTEDVIFRGKRYGVFVKIAMRNCVFTTHSNCLDDAAQMMWDKLQQHEVHTLLTPEQTNLIGQLMRGEVK